MRKLIRCVRDQRGMAFPLVIAMTLALLLLLCVLMEFFRLSLIASGVKEALQDAVVTVVNDNYANVYHGVREGYSGGYYTEGYGFEEAVDTGDVYYHLDETLGTRTENGTRVKYAGGVLEYRITGLDVEIRNAPLAPSDPQNAQRFEADAEIWLEVPVRFAGKTLPAMKMRLKVQAGYIEVF